MSVKTGEDHFSIVSAYGSINLSKPIHKHNKRVSKNKEIWDSCIWNLEKLT